MNPWAKQSIAANLAESRSHYWNRNETHRRVTRGHRAHFQHFSASIFSLWSLSSSSQFQRDIENGYAIYFCRSKVSDFLRGAARGPETNVPEGATQIYAKRGIYFILFPVWRLRKRRCVLSVLFNRSRNARSFFFLDRVQTRPRSGSEYAQVKLSILKIIPNG